MGRAESKQAAQPKTHELKVTEPSSRPPERGGTTGLCGLVEDRNAWRESDMGGTKVRGVEGGIELT